MNWNSSILWGIIGLVGGFLISLLFFTLSKKKRKISYSIVTTPIIVKKITKISDLSIKYKDKNIDNLSTSHITIKNIGNDTLENTDFPELNKLSIITDGIFLINSVQEIDFYKSNRFMKITPTLISSNEIELTFDYIDPKDSFSCILFHTGDIEIDGSLKNGKIIDGSQTNKINEYKQILERILHILLILFAFMALFGFTFADLISIFLK